MATSIRPPNAGIGRVKGVPNKITASVKAALVEAFEERGGVPALLRWAEKNETAFYQIWSKMLPAEVDVTSNGQSISGLAALAYARAEILRQQQLDDMEEIQAPQTPLLESKAS